MRFALSVHGGSDLHFAQGVVVTLDQQGREALLRRRALFQGLRAYEPELLYMKYADCVDWVEAFKDGKLAELIEQKRLIVDPPMAAIPAGELLHAECEACVIDQQGVYWTCLVKHTEVWLETTLIPWDLIEGKE